MGKVFTSEQIRLGQFPDPGAHNAAAQRIAERVLFSGDSLVGSGLIHGSATNGESDIRSDLDMLIIATADGDALHVIREIITDEATTNYVPVELKVISSIDVHAQTHGVDQLFLRYLQEAEKDERFTYGMPASELRAGFCEKDFTVEALVQVVRRYIGAKTERFAGVLASQNQPEERHLQRALELPKNLGRKVLGLFDQGCQQPIQVIGKFENLMKSIDPDNGRQLVIDSQLLSELDRRYTALVESGVDVQEHSDWIDQNQTEIIQRALMLCDCAAHIFRAHTESIMHRLRG